MSPSLASRVISPITESEASLMLVSSASCNRNDWSCPSPERESGVEGFCNYKSSRVEFLQGEEGKILNSLDFNVHSSHIIFEEITKGIELFLKLDKYEYQNEYRLVWFSNEEIKNSIIVRCPEAVKFCEKIIF